MRVSWPRATGRDIEHAGRGRDHAQRHQRREQNIGDGLGLRDFTPAQGYRATSIDRRDDAHEAGKPRWAHVSGSESIRQEQDPSIFGDTKFRYLLT